MDSSSTSNSTIEIKINDYLQKLPMNKSFISTIQTIIDTRDYMGSMNILYGNYHLKQYSNECLYLLSTLTDVQYANNDFAMFVIGLMHWLNIYNEDDCGEKYFNKSIELNKKNPYSLCYVYLIKIYGTKISTLSKKDHDKYKKMLTMCAQLGFVDAYAHLYRLDYGNYGYVCGSDDKYDDIKHFKSLCDDHSDGIKYCQELIKHNKPQGYYYLARLCRDGLGVKKDLKTAMQLYITGYNSCNNNYYHMYKDRIRHQVSKIFDSENGFQLLRGLYSIPCGFHNIQITEAKDADDLCEVKLNFESKTEIKSDIKLLNIDFSLNGIPSQLVSRSLESKELKLSNQSALSNDITCSEQNPKLSESPESSSSLVPDSSSSSVSSSSSSSDASSEYDVCMIEKSEL
jgi:hypothetical protein